MDKSPYAKVEVAAGPRFKAAARSVTEALEKALCFLAVQPLPLVSVALVSDKEMRRVNNETRGKDEPTTVLSFPETTQFPPEEGYRALGEIVLAPETITRKGEDIARLAVHGLLHLLGYTHDGESDTMEMERLESEVFKEAVES